MKKSFLLHLWQSFSTSFLTSVSLVVLIFDKAQEWLCGTDLKWDKHCTSLPQVLGSCH